MATLIILLLFSIKHFSFKIWSRCFSWGVNPHQPISSRCTTAEPDVFTAICAPGFWNDSFSRSAPSRSSSRTPSGLFFAGRRRLGDAYDAFRSRRTAVARDRVVSQGRGRRSIRSAIVERRDVGVRAQNRNKKPPSFRFLTVARLPAPFPFSNHRKSNKYKI